MYIYLTIFSITLAALPGILLRYLPFSKFVTIAQKRKLLFYYAVCFSLQNIVMYLLFHSLPADTTPVIYKLFIFSNSLFYVAINILVIKSFFYQHLLAFGLQSGYSFLLHSLVAIIQGIYGENLSIYMQFFYQSITYILLFSIITLFIWKYIKKSIVFTSTIHKDYFWHIIWLIPVLAVYSNVLATMNQQWINTWQQFISRILMGAAIVLSWRYINLDLKSFEHMFSLQNTNKLLSIQTESIQKQIKTLEENNKKVSILKHDMRHHLRLISTLIEQDNIPEASLLITQLNTSLSNTKSIFFCKNTVINSALLIYNEQAEANHIKILSEIKLPDSIPWNSNDIAILFANAFENAIHASIKQPINRREIKIIASYTDHKLAIKIINRFDGIISLGANGLPVTKLSNHGIGIQSILSIVEKYNAHISACHKEGWFTLSFLFAASQTPKYDTLF